MLSAFNRCAVWNMMHLLIMCLKSGCVSCVENIHVEWNKFELYMKLLAQETKPKLHDFEMSN